MPNWGKPVLPLVAVLVALSACGGENKTKPEAGPQDPAVTSALADQIMVDPDLVDQSRADAAVAVVGPPSAPVPPEQAGPEAVAAARADAARLVGGAIRPAPDPVKGGADALIRDVATAAQFAASAKTGNVDCAGKVEYSARWAAMLPAPLAVYPRGAVQEAAGTDADGCRLRVVHFVTPVAVDDVIAFYYTQLSAAGYNARRHVEGDAQALGGSKGTAAYMIQARRKAGGALTEVDLAASGG